MTQSIVAMGGGGFTMGDPILDRYILGFVDAARPRVCFLPTGASNVATYVVRFLDAFHPPRSSPLTSISLIGRSPTWRASSESRM
jgi:dipeptidase E